MKISAVIRHPDNFFSEVSSESEIPVSELDFYHGKIGFDIPRFVQFKPVITIKNWQKLAKAEQLSNKIG